MFNIQKLKLKNYRRFITFEVPFDDKMNIIIGDNEAGKSSLLSAIDLALSGSRYKVEALGLDNLFNATIIKDFLDSEKKYDNLPILSIELYFNETGNFYLNGNSNSDEEMCDGIKLECKPNDELSVEIKDILNQSESNFPFEYYQIKFTTFQGDAYSSYRKFLKHITIDSSKLNSEYAMKEYVKNLYHDYASSIEKNRHANEYRKHKETFKDNILTELNKLLDKYSFAIRNNLKANLETDLTLIEGGISIDNKGNGKKSIIKTEFALNRSPDKLDVLLIEEPENHLSHLNMKKLINDIQSSNDKQLFIATHSNLVSSRLNLRKSILLNSNDTLPVLMNSLPESTANFFMKAPDNNILEFVMSKKVILVEGDAEFILMEALYKIVIGSDLHSSDIHIISVGGTSFKRYLEVAKVLKIKTAVIRDNDKNYQEKCVENFKEYSDENTQVFADPDDSRYTFEICIYQNNTAICDELFLADRKTLSVQEYMLGNKANVAFELLENKALELDVPQYIKDAIIWISE